MAQSSGGTWLLLGGGVLLAALVFVPFLFVAAALGGIGGNGNDGGSIVAGGTCNLTKNQAYQAIDSKNDEPPAALVPVYRGAAERFGLGPKGPSILAGIHKIETNFSRLDAEGVRSGQNPWGAAGPMQIGNGTGAAGNSWATYGTDGDGDGNKDIYHPVDAIFSAANYLKGHGAPGDWQGAIFGYNHAQWYVDDVVAEAEKFDLPGPAPC